MDIKQQRTEFMKQAFKKLNEEGERTKESLSLSIEAAKVRREKLNEIYRKSLNNSIFGFGSKSSTNKTSDQDQRPKRSAGFSFLCGTSRPGPSRSQVAPQGGMSLREEMLAISKRQSSERQQREDAVLLAGRRQSTEGAQESSEFSDRFDQVQIQLPSRRTAGKRSTTQVLREKAVPEDSHQDNMSDEERNN